MFSIKKNIPFLSQIKKSSTLSFLSLRYFSVLGMDIGCTNSYVAIMESTGPRIIENAEGLRSSPSIICVEEDGKEQIATAAKRQSITNIKNSFYGVNVFFGRKYTDPLVNDLIKKFPFKITSSSEGFIRFLTEKELEYNPMTVNALVFKYLKEQADGFTGKSLKKVVLSVPNYMTDHAKKEIEESAKISGIQISKFIDEGIASAYAYNLDKQENVKNVVVVNFGGSVFSLYYLKKDKIQQPEKENKDKEETKSEDKKETSVINEEIEFKVQNYFIDYFLGGEDIDLKIESFLLEEFKKANKMDISKELGAIQRLREAAEKSKIELTLSNFSEISLPYLSADQSGPKHLNARLTRPKLEILMDEITTRMKNNCLSFLKENKIDKDKDIDEVILLGGTTRMPLIQDAIKSIFGKSPNKNVNPEEASVMGASIFGSLIKEEVEEIKTIDKLPLSIGIETLGGKFLRILEKDTLVPCRVVKSFRPASDNQSKLDIKIYMGEREIASENKLIGSTSAKLILTPKEDQKLNLTFSLNDSGDLNLGIQDTFTRKSTNYSCKINTGLTKDYVTEVLELAEKFKQADSMAKELFELKVEVDSFVSTLQKLILKESIVLSSNEELKVEIIENIKKVEESLNTDNYSDIVNDYDRLQNSYNKLKNLTNENETLEKSKVKA